MRVLGAFATLALAAVALHGCANVELSHQAFEDTTLFVLPLYQLSDPSNKTATSVFREAYCDARTIGYKEDFTYLFNTAVVQGAAPATGATYLTRESFKNAESAKMHLKNVSTVFTRALTTASATGFALLGSQADLDGMADVITKFKADAYVLDPRSFRRSAMHRIQDYFSLDIFLTLKDPADLKSFQKTWGEVRDLAITRSGVLSFGMGIQTSADGKTVTAYFKEYFESADDFFEWEKVSAPYVKRLLDISSVATKPNPVAMTSSAAQLAKAQEKCKQLGCVQYTIDDCTSAADAFDFERDSSVIIV